MANWDDRLLYAGHALLLISPVGRSVPFKYLGTPRLQGLRVMKVC